MKNLKVTFTVLALVALGFVNAAEKNIKDDEITKELSVILGAPRLEAVEADLTAKVSFLVNSKREIVVVQVNTENVLVEQFIKNKLNYSKLETAKLETGKTYTVNVRIQPSL